jgi:hypothetical protein
MQKDVTFFMYSRFTDEELGHSTALLHNNSTKEKDNEFNELAGETERNLRQKVRRKDDNIENFVTEISDLLHTRNTINKSKAGSFTPEPAADGRVRTDTSVHGGDYLQNV